MPWALEGPARVDSRDEAWEAVADGEVDTRGNKADRATRTAAWASRSCASACKTFWFEMLTCSSRAFSAGSPKISHQLPFSTPSLGCDSFHPAGGGSLKATGTAVPGG